MSTMGTIIAVTIKDEVVLGFGINGGLTASQTYAFAELMVENLDLSLDKDNLKNQAEELLSNGVFDAASIVLSEDEFDTFNSFVTGTLNITDKTFTFGEFFLEEDHDEVRNIMEEDEEELLLIFPYETIPAIEEVLLTTADWVSRVVEQSKFEYLAFLSEDILKKENNSFISNPDIPNAHFIHIDKLMELIEQYGDDNVYIGKLEE